MNDVATCSPAVIRPLTCPISRAIGNGHRRTQTLHTPPRTPITLTYDHGRYDFVGAVSAILGVEDAAMLGLHPRLRRMKAGNDQDTSYHRRFYALVERFLPTYQRFITEVVAQMFAEPFCYQRVPTLRIQLLMNVAVGEFHLDSDYNHQPGEVNFWVPITPCWGTNSIWMESEADRSDFHPVRLKPGQCLVFDANRLRHGNVVNETGATRVSFDFRCMPLERYVDREAQTVAAGMALRIGEYYELFHPRAGKGRP